MAGIVCQAVQRGAGVRHVVLTIGAQGVLLSSRGDSDTESIIHQYFRALPAAVVSLVGRA